VSVLLHYNVVRTSSDSQIKAAYRRLSIVWHPDRINPELPDTIKDLAAKVIRKINESYESIRTADVRALYDETLAEQLGKADGIAEVLRAGAYGKMLAVVTRLRQFDLTLPQIVVFGTESSGKSSLMERIAMKSLFPRDRDFCTRMPIKLIMRYSPHENTTVFRIIRIGAPQMGRDGRIGAPQRFTEEERTMHVSNEAAEAFVEKKMQEFLAKHHVGAGVTVDHEIELEIRAANVPDLELIDLPGIVASPVELNEKTLAITRRFIDNPNTLVLCVASARSMSESIRSPSSIGEVAKRSTLPPRCIVALTKVDTVGCEETRDILSKCNCSRAGAGDSLGFKPRCVVPVIHRKSQGQGGNVTLTEQFEIEQEVFEDWGPAMGNDAPRGVNAVLRELNAMLENHTKDYWVDAEIAKKEAELKQIEEEEAKFGKAPAKCTVAEVLEDLEFELFHALTVLHREEKDKWFGEMSWIKRSKHWGGAHMSNAFVTKSMGRCHPHTPAEPSRPIPSRPIPIPWWRKQKE